MEREDLIKQIRRPFSSSTKLIFRMPSLPKQLEDYTLKLSNKPQANVSLRKLNIDVGELFGRFELNNRFLGPHFFLKISSVCQTSQKNLARDKISLNLTFSFC